MIIIRNEAVCNPSCGNIFQFFGNRFALIKNQVKSFLLA